MTDSISSLNHNFLAFEQKRFSDSNQELPSKNPTAQFHFNGMSVVFHINTNSSAEEIYNTWIEGKLFITVSTFYNWFFSREQFPFKKAHANYLKKHTILKKGTMRNA